MSLRGSAQKSAAQFMVPLDRLVDIRAELERRARAADIAGQSAVCTSHQFAINELSKTISATRAAGKTDSNRSEVLDRAAARLLQRMAEDLDSNADSLLEQAETAPALRQPELKHQAQTSEAEASRLWYVLTTFMEHTGVGPEDLEVPAIRDIPTYRPRDN